ncbi:MAG: chorismate synthase [Bacteroidia bacterium]
MNSIGTNIRLTSYGESHGESIGAILDGFPSNFKIDFDFIQAQMNRRRPGQSEWTTAREEKDEFSINSGIFEGLTTGAPIHIFIENKDAQSKDYDALEKVYRPSHADYTYQAKYGVRDHRGGGRSSARITAAWVAAGSIAQDYLQRDGIEIGAFVKQIGLSRLDVNGHFFSRNQVDTSELRCPDETISNQMKAEINAAKEDGDSLGGVIQCVIQGLPAGVGEPLFEKLQAKLALYMLAINAVKGIAFGGGFEMSAKRGSEVNDAFITEGEIIKTSSNNSGGIQGGISNGMPIYFDLAFKPTATINKAQETVSSNGEKVVLEAKGRHDPCVVPRAVPIVETMTALCLMDLLCL